jgi:hypothetical protein
MTILAGEVRSGANRQGGVRFVAFRQAWHG